MVNSNQCYPNCNIWGRLELARTYVVPQTFCSTFPLNKALSTGTLYPELLRPYQKRRV
jgi:ABC-type uncharacterized transport system permease subunit